MIPNRYFIFSIVAAFYSAIFSYLGIIVNPAFAPLIFIILSIGITLILAFKIPNSLGKLGATPIYRWILFYLIIAFIWVLLPNAQATQREVRLIVLSLIFLFIMTLLISFDDNKLTITRKAILTVTIFTIAGNIAEFFIPDLFSSLDSGYNITGRSAGLYLNANTSGEAIILGMILSYSMLDKKYRTFFLVASLLGVISTFSRTAIASWFVVVAILSYGKVIDKKNIAMVLGSLVLVGIFIVPFVIHYIETNLEAGTVTNLMTRLNFFSSKSQGLDGSQQQRLEVARAALENFANNPLIGAGIAHTSHWEFPISTHNIYLKLMAEYGIIGVFLYPLLILSTVWKAKNEAVAIARAFSIYLLIIGFTTHNSLDEHHLLIAFAVMANLTYHSKTTNSNSPLSSNY